MPSPTLRAPLAPAGDLIVTCDLRVVTPHQEFSFRVALAENSAEPLEDFALTFPGFVQASAPCADHAGGWRVHGYLTRPGFYAFECGAKHRGKEISGCDYFLVREPQPIAAPDEAGYYVFLGCGDYPIITGEETHPLAAWTLDQWKELLAWMGANGMNRFWVLVNGYTLAYPSQRYPELRDRHARNVRDNFLRELIDHGHAHGVKTVLMFTTDGHGRDFVHLHPETARQTADGQPGVHYGLCLEHPRTRRYIFDMLEEALELYPNADGVAVHPTESDPDRFNPETLAAFRRDTGRDLRAEPKESRYAWYNQTYARFLAEFGARARRDQPARELIMANCWWQDDYVDINHAELPPEWRIAVWYYAWEDDAPKPWFIHRWHAAFGAERLIYVPTSQSYLYPNDARQVMTRHIGIDRLVSTAAALGVRNTLYFAGWEILGEPACLADVLLARHPTALLAPAAERRALIPDLYADYFGARDRLFSARRYL